MICDSCRRDVDYVRGSFWHGEARICRECFAQWCDPNNDQVGPAEAAGIGNYVRLRHGLPPLAAAVAILSLIVMSTAYASRHCLDRGEAARTWPTRVLTKDADGCWTYERHRPRMEIPVAAPETAVSDAAPTLMDRWADTDLFQIELRQLEPNDASQTEPLFQPQPLVNARQFALFVSLVLAAVAVVEVATSRHGSSAQTRRARPHTPD
jgi:hypothetical protein